MPGHSFKFSSGIDEARNISFVFIGLTEFLGGLKCLFKRNAKRDKLCHAVAKTIRESKRPACVAHHGTCSHGAKSPNLGNVFVAIFLAQILDYLIAAPIGKI